MGETESDPKWNLIPSSLRNQIHDYLRLIFFTGIRSIHIEQVQEIYSESDPKLRNQIQNIRNQIQNVRNQIQN